MSEAELRRLRQDLETIRQAAGLDLPFGRTDVWLALGLVPAGALLSAWAWLGPEEYLAFGLAPLVLLALAALAREAWKRHRGSGAARREQTLDALGVLVVAAGLAAYFVWRRGLGLPQPAAGAVACFFVGVMSALVGLTSRPRRAMLAAALAFIPFALAIPYCGGKQAVAAVGGLAVALAGLGAAAIMAWQLRGGGGGHERATN
jgi:hypothetical protein